MSNHLHVVLKTRPDLGNLWDDSEVNRRWRLVFPLRNKPKDVIRSITERELADKKLMGLRRARLASVSWFMRCLLEPIARRANAEDQCGGRFWEERFKCVGLLDDSAILSCTAYVDLNPVRAGLAKSPEASQFTSIFDRIEQRQTNQVESAAADNWLAPISNKERHSKPNWRASHLPWLDMSLEEYLELLDWTGRQLREDKKGAIPKELPPILERLKIQSPGWLLAVKEFGQLFRRFAGQSESLEARARLQGRRHIHGLAAAKEVFG